MKAAVTGGGGFLGAHVTRALIEEGVQVTALLRPGGDRRNLEGLDLEVVEGDLGSDTPPAAFPGPGTDLLIHLAALYSEEPEDEELLFRVNVEGTRAVLLAALRDAVPRIVHTSTMGTCTPAAHGGPATEQDHVTPGPSASAYARSKLAGEELALSLAPDRTIVVNPAAPVGAFDRKPTVTGRRVLDVLEGRWPRLLEGPVNYVPARSCARGILLAAAKGRPGERYLLGGENLGPDAFVSRVAAAAGIPVPRRSLLDRLLRRRLPTKGQLTIDDTRARTDLGYDPGPLDEAVREAAIFFREHRRPAGSA